VTGNKFYWLTILERSSSRTANLRSLKFFKNAKNLISYDTTGSLCTALFARDRDYKISFACNKLAYK
jgi:hypothetical protein